jgi:hypothetical protein
MADTGAIIQATLAPIFLVSGAAIFLNFTQARLFRVVDRLRAIGTQLRHEEVEAARDDLRWQRTRHLTRAVLLRNAILFEVLVVALTVTTALLLLIPNAFGGFDPGRSPIVTFALALVCFAVALGLVTADAFMSVASATRAAREFGDESVPGPKS